MLEENKRMLDEEISNVLKELKNTKIGTDEYHAVRSDLEGLYKLGMEQEKIENCLKTETAKIDAQREKNIEELKTEKERIKVESRREYARTGTDFGGTMIKVGVKLFMFMLGLRFEETGSISSPVVKNLISIDPTKN